ncbi:hypothetical protein IF1G_05178 [Cordyceps javanica]|uniref:Uncharacterized protein n=1 Tax=Cordyceps javanica TaxID=43265 RepID=A0A545V4E6_9HYPO|nr:hypothetical protein IF1G_05178 [Cordyceps javanica]
MMRLAQPPLACECRDPLALLLQVDLFDSINTHRWSRCGFHSSTRSGSLTRQVCKKKGKTDELLK